MPLIGILSNKKSENEFKKILTQKTHREQKKFDIIIINDTSIENLKNIKFETIVIDREDIYQYKECLKTILKNVKYLIVNLDLVNDMSIIKDMELTVITYGFNSKSTITASSVEDENNMLCLQRNIKTIYNKIIEEQEISINFNSSNRYVDMGVVAIMLIYQLK